MNIFISDIPQNHLEINLRYYHLNSLYIFAFKEDERKAANKGFNLPIISYGPRLSPEIKDKIFQPLFTTKPTDSGIGLGSSLSYDIVKAHGGIISVDSTKSIGTVFTITLPVKV